MCNPHDARHPAAIASAFLSTVFLLALASDAVADPVSLGFGSRQAGENGIPKPWMILGNPKADEPAFHVEQDDQRGPVLQLHAKGNQSDGIYRPAEVDLGETPFINFSWKVRIHPDGQVGTSKSDAAIKIQLDFGRHLFKRRVLSYIFDPKAEAGRCYDDSSFFAVNRAIVLDSGSDKLGEWLSHSRNVAEDYRAVYGAEPPELQNVSLFCDSNDSNSESLGYCTGITFTEKPRSATK